MTRTERAAYPRAVERDRSESKGGVDKSIRKGGGGAHNWGSLEDEQRFEQEGSFDELRELRDDENNREEDEEEPAARDSASGVTERQTERPRATSGGLSPQELEKAKALRKRGLSDNVDLSDIARSSQAVTASADHPISIIPGATTKVDAFEDI